MEAMKLHQEAIVVDGHCDTLLELYTKKRSFWEENSGCQLDWHLARSGKINLQFIACFLEPQYKPFGALSRILELLDLSLIHIWLFRLKWYTCNPFLKYGRKIITEFLSVYFFLVH